MRIQAVVKANAYGHGLAEVARVLAGRVEMFGVANVAEGRELRNHIPEAEVFILGPAIPEEREEIVRCGFVPAISSFHEAEAYAALARDRPVSIHVAIDTGMGRIGIWEEDAVAVIRAISQLGGVKVSGIASHFPSADEDEAFTRQQLVRFRRLTGELQNHFRPCATHIANSAGLIRFPADAGDLVRAGLMLYGSSPVQEFQPRLRPVMTWKTRITLLRDVGAGRGISYGRTFITPRPMRVATLGAGYADGYQRHLSHRGAEVLIRGQRCAVLGRVTMDQIMVDVTAVAETSEGDEAVLLGRQGEHEITAAELAQRAGTIPWEIFTGVGRRVERVACSAG